MPLGKETEQLINDLKNQNLKLKQSKRALKEKLEKWRLKTVPEVKGWQTAHRAGKGRRLSSSAHSSRHSKWDKAVRRPSGRSATESEQQPGGPSPAALHDLVQTLRERVQTADARLQDLHAENERLRQQVQDHKGPSLATVLAGGAENRTAASEHVTGDSQELERQVKNKNAQIMLLKVRVECRLAAAKPSMERSC